MNGNPLTRWRRASLPAALALALSCAGGAHGQSVDDLIRDLIGAESARRAAALEKLAALGATAAPRLTRVAQSAGDDEVRLAALDALSRNPSSYAYSYLFWESLPRNDERETGDRRRIWACLVRVGDAFIAVGELGAASDHYCDLLESAASPAERSVAIRGLGRAGRRRAAEEVFAALEDDDASVVAAAVAAAAEMRWGQALPHFERRMKTAGAALLVSLLEALSMRAEPEAAALVAQFTDDDTAAVRDAARRARARHAGFVTDWWVVGPLSDPDGALRGTDVVSADVRPVRGATVESGGRTFTWRVHATSDPRGIVDLGHALEARGCGGAYAYAEVWTSNARTVRFTVAASGETVVWLNGKRARSAGDEAAIDATLAAGANRILVKFLGRSDAWTFRVRATDERGAPIVSGPPR